MYVTCPQPWEGGRENDGDVKRGMPWEWKMSLGDLLVVCEAWGRVAKSPSLKIVFSGTEHI